MKKLNVLYHEILQKKISDAYVAVFQLITLIFIFFSEAFLNHKLTIIKNF